MRDFYSGKGLTLTDLVLDNGSGLSRRERISAASMAQVLQAAWASPVMPEFVASLPLVGFDGTMKRRLKLQGVAGQAHVKTGTLADVRAVAGYVLAASGKSYVVVVFVNHPNAGGAQAAQDAARHFFVLPQELEHGDGLGAHLKNAAIRIAATEQAQKRAELDLVGVLEGRLVQQRQLVVLAPHLGRVGDERGDRLRRALQLGDERRVALRILPQPPPALVVFVVHRRFF